MKRILFIFFVPMFCFAQLNVINGQGRLKSTTSKGLNSHGLLQQTRTQSVIPPVVDPGVNLGNNNWLITDKYGNNHVMVEIPAFNWDPVNGFASSTIHPAFIVNGVQKRIFIGKYECSVLGGKYVTQANGIMATSLDYDASNAACSDLNNGTTITGFHLMTNAEWAAVAIVSKSIMGSTEVLGNNNEGADWQGGTDPGTPLPGAEDIYGNSDEDYSPWLTGSGGITTSHNGTASGVYDLNGNVWEWNKGLRLNNGEINIIPNNNAALSSADITSTSALWKAILEDGTLVAPGTANTLKYQNGTGKISKTTENGSWGGSFESITCASDVSSTSAGVILLKKLLLVPSMTGLFDDYFYYYGFNNEAIPFRGGSWNYGSNAGLFFLFLGYSRTYASSTLGFRVAFVQ